MPGGDGGGRERQRRGASGAGAEGPSGAAVIPGKRTQVEQVVASVTPAGAQPQPPQPQISGIPSQEIEVSIGQGGVTGKVVLTITAGSTGYAPGDGHIKILQNKAKLALDNLAVKLEGEVLKGSFSANVIDGVQVTFGVSALKFGTRVSGDNLKFSSDLLAVDVGLQGDVTHWLGYDVPGVSCKLQGKLQIALGEKVLAQIKDLAAKEAEEKSLATELETAGTELETQESKLASAEARRAALDAGGASHDALEALDDEILAQRGAVWRQEEVVGNLGRRLQFTREAAEDLAREAKGPVARQLAKIMEHETVQLVAEKLAHVVPVLDAAMLAMDTFQAIRSIYHLAHGDAALIVSDTLPVGGGDKGDVDGEAIGPRKGRSLPPHRATSAITKPDGGASGTRSGSASASEAGARAPAPASGPQPQAAGASTSSRGTLDDTVVARRGLSPAARRVLEAIAPRDGQGVELTPSDIKKLGALIPSDLSPYETREVIATVLRPGARATNAADALQSIESAVRTVRGDTRDRAPDRPPNTAMNDGPITDPRQVDRDQPVRSSGQDRQTRDAEASDWLLVARSAPPAVIARWFVEDHGELVPSQQFEQWKTSHVGSTAESLRLADVVIESTRTGDAHWNVAITFVFENPQRRREQVRHTFFVNRDPPSSIGASFRGLNFEPYVMITTVPAKRMGD